MALKPLKFTDPVSAADVDRFQQNVQQALQGEAAPEANVISLKTSPNLKSYAVKTTDAYIVVDSSAGEFTVSLPTPKAKQVVTVAASADTTNPVIVKRADGQQISGQSQFSLLYAFVFVRGNASVFICDGKTWVRA